VLSRFQQEKIDRAEGELYQECKDDTCDDLMSFKQHDDTRLNEYLEWLDEEPDPVIIPKPPAAVENIQEDEKSKAEQSDFMVFLKTKNKKALVKLVVYENEKFDFRCKIGTVGQFFLTVNFIEKEDREFIAKHITIVGEPTTAEKLKNAYGNIPPNEWGKIDLFNKSLNQPVMVYDTAD
jgi:hypothetical protein